MYSLNQMRHSAGISKIPAISIRRRRGWVPVLSVGGVLILVFGWHGLVNYASASEPPALYTVQPGDTVWSIASKESAGADPRPEVSLIISANHLSEENPQVVPGQVLRVPRQ